MQISKTLLTCGAAALCFIATSARAVDTEADLKLREALRQKMAEVGPETSAPAVAPAPSKPVKAAKPAKAVKAPAQPAPVAPVAPAPIAKPAAPVVVQPAQIAAPAQAAAPAAVDEAQAERLREALRVRLQQEQANPTPPQQVVTHGSDLEPAVSTTKIVAPATTVVAPVAAPTEPAVVPAPTVKAAPVTLVAPASPIPASKEARLAALLQQYKTDQISPQQYHEQRAKILAE